MHTNSTAWMPDWTPEMNFLLDNEATSIRVNGEKLEEKKFYHYIQDFLGFKSAENSKKLRDKIIKVLSDNKKSLNPQMFKNNIKWKDDVQKLFNERIAALHDKELIKHLSDQKLGDECILNHDMQDFLLPELGTERAERAERAEHAEKKTKRTDSEKLEHRILIAKLAIQLGVGIEGSKGATGTVIVSSLKDKKIGVFKPNHTHVSLLTKIKNIFKRSVGGQLAYLSSENDAQSKAEVAAYLLDRHFGFNIAPASKMDKLNSQEGAFQLFIEPRYKNAEHELKEAKDVLNVLSRKGFTDDELTIYQKFIIFDYLIGNLDRHEENWFVEIVDNKIKDIQGIDNANSFLNKNPSLITQKNQYKWKTLGISEKKFTNDSLKFIKDKLTEKTIEDFFTSLESNNEMKDFMNPQMKELLKERIAVLKRLDTNDSPQILGNLTTDEDIGNFKKDSV